MKNTCIYILAAFAASACAHVDPAAKEYAGEFLAAAKARGYDVASVRIVITPLRTQRDHAVGECEFGVNKIIRIDPSAWASMSDRCKRVLVFHELGHCTLHGTAHFESGVMRAQLDCDAALETVFERRLGE